MTPNHRGVVNALSMPPLDVDRHYPGMWCNWPETQQLEQARITPPGYNAPPITRTGSKNPIDTARILQLHAEVPTHLLVTAVFVGYVYLEGPEPRRLAAGNALEHARWVRLDLAVGKATPNELLDGIEVLLVLALVVPSCARML